MPSGKSMSVTNPKGIRRKDKDGNELAPRSLRRRKRFLKDCSDTQLNRLGLLEKKEVEEQE